MNVACDYAAAMQMLTTEKLRFPGITRNVGCSK